jgi:hypothetical protein
MQEIKLQQFIQEVLQKNTYNSPRNKCANPSCNTFLQERSQNMPKNPFLEQVLVQSLADQLQVHPSAAWWITGLVITLG